MQDKEDDVQISQNRLCRRKRKIGQNRPYERKTARDVKTVHVRGRLDGQINQSRSRKMERKTRQIGQNRPCRMKKKATREVRIVHVKRKGRRPGKSETSM